MGEGLRIGDYIIDGDIITTGLTDTLTVRPRYYTPSKSGYDLNSILTVDVLDAIHRGMSELIESEYPLDVFIEPCIGVCVMSDNPYSYKFNKIAESIKESLIRDKPYGVISDIMDFEHYGIKSDELLMYFDIINELRNYIYDQDLVNEIIDYIGE